MIVVEYITPRVWQGLSFTGGQQWFMCKIGVTIRLRTRNIIVNWQSLGIDQRLSITQARPETIITQAISPCNTSRSAAV